MKVYSQIILLMVSVLFNCNLQADITGNAKNIALVVMDGWVRLTPPIAKNGAAYFTLHNKSAKPITVVDVKTSIAKTAAMHKVEIYMSMVKMVHLEQLIIAAGEKVVFAPGGKHLMLINLTQKLEANKIVEISFILKNGAVVIAKMPIMKNSPAAPDVVDGQHKHHH